PNRRRVLRQHPFRLRPGRVLPGRQQIEFEAPVRTSRPVKTDTGIEANDNNIRRCDRDALRVDDRTPKSSGGSILRPQDASNEDQGEQNGNKRREDSVPVTTRHGNPPASKTSEREDLWGDLVGCSTSTGREM